MGSLSQTKGEITKMKLVPSLVLLLVGLVLLAAVGEVAGGPRSIRRQGRRPLRQRMRQGRQEEVEGGEQAALDEAAALPNGCDPESPTGAFLLFRGVKVWCGNQGVDDFGPYGAQDGRLDDPVVHEEQQRTQFLLGQLKAVE